jgi:hypothetical protein
MRRPPERLKTAANRLAELLASEEGCQILQALAEFGTDETTDARETRPAITGSRSLIEFQPGRVGIWEPKFIDGELCFIRARGSERWSLWAPVGKIRVRREAKRVVLLGESVARGFFYDPRFNPALALQNILHSALGAEDVDVIDLARIGIQLKPLTKLVQEAIALKPDIVVLLAGNNWHPLDGLELEQVQEIGAILRRDASWSRAKTFVEEKLRASIHDFAVLLASLAESHGFKVVIVIPEFNLLDWNELGRPSPILDSEENEKWICARDQARTAWAAGSSDLCAKFAREMLQIDEGSSPVGFRFLANVALKREALSEARLLLQEARDAGIFLPRMDSPRCYSVSQEALRHEARRHGFSLIDLPKLLEEYLSGALPGRAIFHDYCHLTAEGIGVAMGAVAQAILPLLGQEARPWRELAGLAGQLPLEAHAEANFLAAIHNANWGQDFDIVRHHCWQALRKAPAIAEAMFLYADFHIRRAPAMLCHSYDRLASAQYFMGMDFFYLDPRVKKPLNLTAIRAIGSALEAAHPGMQSFLDDLVKGQHTVLKGVVNLLDRAYCSTSYAMLEGDWLERAALYRAYNRRSSFILIAEPTASVSLQITFRTQSAVHSQSLKVEVNGQSIAMLPTSTSWQTMTITVPEELLLEGVNSIVLEWPLPVWKRAEKIAQVSESLERGELAKLYPVYGELHAFRAAIV